jgi:voltage-gated potassium channel Kch
MRRLFLIAIVSVVALTACNNSDKPSEDNFRKVINEYFAKHGKVCTSIGRQFPIDVSESELKTRSGTATQMATLEAAGLVHSSNTIATIPGIMAPTAPIPVRRYELTEEGKKYFQQLPGNLGQTTGFCYGEKTVDSIVKWTEPMTMGSYSQTEVTYTYKIKNLASWAERSDVQRAFWDIGTTVDGTSKSNQIVGLQLMNHGWEVLGQ